MRAHPVWLDDVLSLCNEAAGLINILALFVSSHSASRVRELPTRETVLKHIEIYERFLELLRSAPLEEGNQRFLSSAPHLARLRELFHKWDPSHNIPEDIMNNARLLIETALGVPSPPGGWEEFDGFPESGW
jgi:hypothetical protein